MANLGLIEVLLLCLMPLLAVLVVVGVGLLIWVLARGGSRQAPASTATGETALDILKARYARGEITQEQFEQLKRDIGASDVKT